MSVTKPTIPTLQAIRDRMMADVAYYLPGSGNRPYKSVLTVLITVFAGAVWSLYLFADWILRQLDPKTADEVWLEKWAAKLGVPRKAATYATGSVTLTGTGEIPAGTVLQVSDRRRYLTTQAGVAGAATPLQAESPGYAGNIPTSSILSLVNPIAGVQLNAPATAITGGADQETLTAWAQRIDEHLQQRQQIGDADDYARWAKQAHPAIEDAWVYSNTPDLGDISIYCLITSGSDVATVLPVASAALNRLANVCGTRHLLIPESLPVAVRIVGVESTVQAVVTAEIQTLFAQKRRRAAVLFPQEIERLIADHTTAEFVLLEPNRRITATDTQIMELSGVVYE